MVSGMKALVLLYGGNVTQSLNEIRTLMFIKKTKLHSEFKDIQNYPPTLPSASLHSQRIFLQVMAWQNIYLNPLQWGYLIKDGYILPAMGDQEVAPDIILHKIKCACTTGCTGRCSCRNFGLECTTSCKKCIDNCHNKKHFIEEFETYNICS